MKKFLAIAVVMMVPSLALAGIQGSKHDLTYVNNTVYTSDTDAELCKFCHIPHNARTDSAALWNRNDPSTTTLSYSDNTTVAGTVLPSVMGGPSLRCFTCHDGSSDIGLTYNGVNDFSMTGTDGDGSLTAASRGNIDATGMNGNHPVSVAYGDGSTYNGTTGTTSGYNVASSVNLGKLYGSATNWGIECGSCHEPHDTSNGFFLRADNGSSDLCLDCHNK